MGVCVLSCVCMCLCVYVFVCVYVCVCMCVCVTCVTDWSLYIGVCKMDVSACIWD